MSHESLSESDSDEEEENYPNEVSVENAAVRDQDNVVEVNANYMEKYQDDDVSLESISIDILWFRKWFWNWRQGNE